MAYTQETWDCDFDQKVDQLIKQYDLPSMPLPNIESQPHLLISKVRKHYMEYLIKLLVENYESNQKLLNKNIYLPSAIWRCAKNIEADAAQMCMIVQLYRQNIVAMIKLLKDDTKKGKLNRKLYECLHIAPINEKNLQTSFNLTEDCICECHCRNNKKRRKTTQSPNPSLPTMQINVPNMKNAMIADINKDKDNSEIPMPQLNSLRVDINKDINETPLPQKNSNDSLIRPPDLKENVQSMSQSEILPKPSVRMSVESQDSDDLMSQMEKLFQGDPSDDDLFDGALCDTADSFSNDDAARKAQSPGSILSCDTTENADNSVIQNHSMQIKSLDERLASLAGLLAKPAENSANATEMKPETPKRRPSNYSKWLCEEYFLKSRLFELLDEIGDTNRKKLARIKETLMELFGADSDDESVISPLEQTPEFVTSCKERIAPWVVKLLTPYYIKGRIRGKALFKALAKHLIRLIYQCSNYPREYEVKSFVTDFLETHKMIRCEADFQEFRIENI